MGGATVLGKGRARGNEEGGGGGDGPPKGESDDVDMTSKNCHSVFSSLSQPRRQMTSNILSSGEEFVHMSNLHSGFGTIHETKVAQTRDPLRGNQITQSAFTKRAEDVRIVHVSTRHAFWVGQS
jgi:hypothetical protein